MRLRTIQALAAVEECKKVVDRFRHVICARVLPFAEQVANRHVLIVSFLVCANSAAQPTTLERVRHIDQQVQRVSVSPVGARADIAQFSPEMVSSGVGKFIELPALVPIESQEMPDQSAKQETQGSPQKSGAGVGYPDGNEVQHHYLSILLFIFSALSAGALGAFIAHALKHGINEAWRDLAFGLPFDVPQWMLFIPKRESDAHP